MSSNSTPQALSRRQLFRVTVITGAVMASGSHSAGGQMKGMLA